MDVRVRPLHRDEGAPLDAVFAGLSPESRYLRFHSPVDRLTTPLRRALLDVDGCRHVALVAESPDGEAVGIARLVRDARQKEQAEVAFEVVDAWQGRGVGRLLLIAIVEEAARIGVSRVHAWVLTGNAAALALVRAVFPVVRSRLDGEAAELICPLPADRPDSVLDDLAA
jgi:GNAT superfamily N-acetyltransferase